MGRQNSSVKIIFKKPISALLSLFKNSIKIYRLIRNRSKNEIIAKAKMHFNIQSAATVIM